jgi:hypothetical protein
MKINRDIILERDVDNEWSKIYTAVVKRVVMCGSETCAMSDMDMKILGT